MYKLFFIVFLASVSSAQTWTKEMQMFAEYTEKQYKLPSGICRAFALQESNYNPFAERVEANYVNEGGTYGKKIRADAYAFAKARRFQPSFLTEVYNRGKSVTMFQIMGQNLRAMGYDQPFLNYISLTDQFHYFGEFVSKLFKKHNGNIGHVASEYNGGAGAVRSGNYRNAGYVRNILSYRQKFQ